MYTRKAAKPKTKISTFIFFHHDEISGVVGRKSEQHLAQAGSIWNVSGQQDGPIRYQILFKNKQKNSECHPVLP